MNEKLKCLLSLFSIISVFYKINEGLMPRIFGIHPQINKIMDALCPIFLRESSDLKRMWFDCDQ